MQELNQVAFDVPTTTNSLLIKADRLNNVGESGIAHTDPRVSESHFEELMEAYRRETHEDFNKSFKNKYKVASHDTLTAGKNQSQHVLNRD